MLGPLGAGADSISGRLKRASGGRVRLCCAWAFASALGGAAAQDSLNLIFSSLFALV